jgi:hypothetical protein
MLWVTHTPGIAARGARTKMLKSIEMLRLRNEAVEHNLMQMEISLDNGPMRPTLLGLCEMLQMPAPFHEVSQCDVIFVNTVGFLESKSFM